MKLDEFLNSILDNIMTEEGIKKVKDVIKEDMKDTIYNYNNTKVEYQVFTENNNYTPQVEVSSEGYSDGEVILIDCHID